MLVSVYICILNSVVIIPSIPGVLTMWLYYPPLLEEYKPHLLNSSSGNYNVFLSIMYRWVDSYKFDVLETLVDGPPKCALCTREACKRCSRCRSEWYCGR